MKPTWKTVLLWTLPTLVVGFFIWQSSVMPNMASNNNTARNTASTRMTYGRFLEYLDANRVKSVDLYDGGRTAIVEAIDPELDNRVRIEFNLAVTETRNQLR